MPSGTVINGVFCPRVHKSNAQEVLEGAEEALQGARECLFMLSSLTPASDMESVSELHREVEDAIKEIQRATWEAWCAQYIIDNPYEVEDELDCCPECEQVGFHKMSCGSQGGGK